MKNKLLVVIPVLLLVAQVDAKAKGVDRITAFRNMESVHKANWFDYMDKVHGEKYALLKQQHAEWVSYGNKTSEDWQKNINCSDEGKDKIFAQQLDKAVALHRKHSAEFEKLCKAQYEDAGKIQARHTKELDTFVNAHK